MNDQTTKFDYNMRFFRRPSGALSSRIWMTFFFVILIENHYISNIDCKSLYRKRNTIQHQQDDYNLRRQRQQKALDSLILQDNDHFKDYKRGHNIMSHTKNELNLTKPLKSSKQDADSRRRTNTRREEKSMEELANFWEQFFPQDVKGLYRAQLSLSMMTIEPTLSPTEIRSADTSIPTLTLLEPTTKPTMKATFVPTIKPTREPINIPTISPTTKPTNKPTEKPLTRSPTEIPSLIPTTNAPEPTSGPTLLPTISPSNILSDLPSNMPTQIPTESQQLLPSNTSSSMPSDTPSIVPAPEVTASPTALPTVLKPTRKPTRKPTTKAPTTKEPTTKAPTTKAPTTKVPTTKAPPTKAPTTKAPTTKAPTTKAPRTKAPTTKAPTTKAPTTKAPTTKVPTTKAPTTKAPTTKAPTSRPTVTPTNIMSSVPSLVSSVGPSLKPSKKPIKVPSSTPTFFLSDLQTDISTVQPTSAPSVFSSKQPTDGPTATISEQPTANPTITSSPTIFTTTDPLTTVCILDATINCTTNNGLGDGNLNCTNLQPPTDSECISDQPVRSLTFIYNGLPCAASNTTSTDFTCTDENGGPVLNPPRPVFITVINVENPTIYFSSIIKFGDLFTVLPRPGETFENEIRIEIYNVRGNDAAEILQTMSLPTTCNDNDNISLLTQYGSLQLTAFASSEQGYQSVFENLSLIFTITNIGKVTALVDDAGINSTLFGERILISDSGIEFKRLQSESFQLDALINLYESAGQTFQNSLAVNGNALQNDTRCPDMVEYLIKIGS